MCDSTGLEKIVPNIVEGLFSFLEKRNIIYAYGNYYYLYHTHMRVL